MGFEISSAVATCAQVAMCIGGLYHFCNRKCDGACEEMASYQRIAGCERSGRTIVLTSPENLRASTACDDTCGSSTDTRAADFLCDESGSRRPSCGSSPLLYPPSRVMLAWCLNFVYIGVATACSSGLMIKGVATMAICFPILLVLHHSLDWGDGCRDEIDGRSIWW